jgi:hypothetical protein
MENRGECWNQLPRARRNRLLGCFTTVDNQSCVYCVHHNVVDAAVIHLYIVSYVGRVTAQLVSALGHWSKCPLFKAQIGHWPYLVEPHYHQLVRWCQYNVTNRPNMLRCLWAYSNNQTKKNIVSWSSVQCLVPDSVAVEVICNIMLHLRHYYYRDRRLVTRRTTYRERR